MKTITMFESNLMTINYTFIDPKTLLINGGSLNLDVEVTGKDRSEMGSFDTVKDGIKELMNEFDYKLWILPDHGDKKDALSWYGNCPSSKRIAFYNHYGFSVVATPKFTLSCNKNIIKICPFDNLFLLERYIEDYLLESLRANRIIVNLVKVRLHYTPVLPFSHNAGTQKSFRYVNVMENIVQGYQSWIVFLDGYNNPVYPDDKFQNKINDEMNGYTFICRDNIISETEFGISFESTTNKKYFNMQFSKIDCKYHIIDTETSVENLADWFYKHFKNEIANMIEKGATKMYFSEGLTKGACVKFKEFDNAACI